MTDVVRINSTILSWNSCSFKFDSIPYIGILSFQYEHSLERTPVQGSKRDEPPLGFTSGKYSVASMSLKMLRDSWDTLQTQLAVKGLGSYGKAVFTFIAQYIETSQLPITVACVGCQIKAVKVDHDEGIGAATVELDLHCVEIVENQKSLASSSAFL
jgi:hypothetical protein